MMTLSNIPWKKLRWWVTPAAGLIGILLTYLSYMQLCSSSCEEAHLYQFYGFNFDIVGFIFFPSLFLLSLLETRYGLISLFVSWMLIGALGAEMVFVYIQKFIIGHWCPVCVSIALTVGLTLLFRVMAFNFSFSNQTEKNGMLNHFWFGIFANCSLFCFGVLLAFFGVAKPVDAYAEDISTDKLFLGNKKSPIEVYVITDWFCPACRKVEPILEECYPEIMHHARLIFVDYVIHSESMNYLPFDLSFMLKNKNQYCKIRAALITLAVSTKTPTVKQIQDAVLPLGVTYEPLDYAEVASGVHYFENITKKFNVQSTPTVIILNSLKPQEVKRLEGKSEITKKNILNSIKRLSLKA